MKNLFKHKRKMQYFEFSSPYYALIKAKNGSSAAKIYREIVADAGDGYAMHLIDREKALVIFSQSPGEHGFLMHPKKIIEDFNDPETELLVADSYFS
jgi:hypothetical protein